MPRNDIGGFFVSLGLDIDKNSFETGNKLIDGMGNGFNKLIGAARNAAVVLAGTAVATGVVESSAYKTATALGITTEALDLWKASAKIAGVNADGLIGSMGKLANVMNHMTIDGSGLEAYSKQLGELGLLTDDFNMEELLKMSPDEAFKKIIDTAQKSLDGTNMTRVTTIVGDILGPEGQNFFIELVRQQKTIDEFLAGAQKTIFTNSGTNQEAADFASEVQTLRTTFESITKLLGSEVGGELTPFLKGINDWIQDNGDEIKTGIENISKLVGAIAQKVAPYAEAVADLVVGAASGNKEKVVTATDNLGYQLASDVSGLSVAELRDKNAVAEAIAQYKTSQGYGPNDWIPYEELPEDLKTGFDLHATKSWGKYRYGGAIKDGIIRPDGTVTQIASDDWVLAARDLGDIARAFIPQNHTAVSAGEYTINQNFTINGGSDIPQVLKQQAYRGTQEGLLEVMNISAQRLQLMSGAR